ncbi:hypothetical protein AGOR_G00030370 [Albula goreensis]|uniref:Uncharacterized protein n=1 Tax=Albula goreensis TaxID=1534307 RepID=A0A8T3E6V8_9TELE|nr:hypothetical protein AGOR_G00030370 [Albula goreensis]
MDDRQLYRENRKYTSLKKPACNMWAADDDYSSYGLFGSLQPSRLQSHSEPTDGRTYIMYHGTTKEAAQKILEYGFHQSRKGMLGRGVYVSRDIEKARCYPVQLSPCQTRVVLELEVKVGRVKMIDYQGHPMQKTWHTVHGYDTAWCPPNCGMVPSGREEDCVWDPKRIRATPMQKTSKSMGTSLVPLPWKRTVSGILRLLYHENHA